jgi:hypothetical protein
MADKHTQVYSPIQQEATIEELDQSRPYRVQYLYGHYFIPLDPKLNPKEGQFVDQKLESNGKWTFEARTN